MVINQLVEGYCTSLRDRRATPPYVMRNLGKVAKADPDHLIEKCRVIPKRFVTCDPTTVQYLLFPQRVKHVKALKRHVTVMSDLTVAESGDLFQLAKFVLR